MQTIKGGCARRSGAIRAVAVIILLAGLCERPRADLLVEYKGNSFGGTGMPNQALAKIVVGNQNVEIGGFSFFGQPLVALNLKFVIFDSTLKTAPVYLSAVQAIAADPGTYAVEAQWYDSPTMTFTLLANHSYAMGAIVDQTGMYWSQTFSAFGGGATVNGDGLSLPFQQSLCNSGVINNSFSGTPTLYTVDNSNRFMHSLRVEAVPEPSTMSLFLSAAVVAALVRLRFPARVC